MKETVYFNIANLITILIALLLYILVLYGIIVAVLRKKSKKTSLAESGDGESFLKYDGPERRLYERAKLSIDVRYRCCTKGSRVNIFKEGKAVDISEGGIGILLETYEKLDVSDKLELKLKLPRNSQFMLIRGDIIWAKELQKERWYRYGVNFIEVDPNDKKLIAKYVEEHKRELES